MRCLHPRPRPHRATRATAGRQRRHRRPSSSIRSSSSSSTSTSSSHSGHKSRCRQISHACFPLQLRLGARVLPEARPVPEVAKHRLGKDRLVSQMVRQRIPRRHQTYKPSHLQGMVGLESHLPNPSGQWQHQHPPARSTHQLPCGIRPLYLVGSALPLSRLLVVILRLHPLKKRHRARDRNCKPRSKQRFQQQKQQQQQQQKQLARGNSSHCSDGQCRHSL